MLPPLLGEAPISSPVLPSRPIADPVVGVFPMAGPADGAAPIAAPVRGPVGRDGAVMSRWINSSSSRMACASLASSSRLALVRCRVD